MLDKETLTKNYYNGISKGYRELYWLEQEKKINLIREFLPKKGLVLDCGSGDGVLNQFLSKNIELISVDLSKDLLNLNSNNNKVVTSITNLPFKANYFDHILSFTVIQDLENPVKGLNEINRVLKEKGQLIISFLKQSSKCQEIVNYIENNFIIIKRVEEEKDLIFILEKN